jgi:hypothetical protein
MMKIRMVKPYAAYRKGEIVELPERDAETLIAWDYATRVEGDDQQLLDDSPKNRRKRHGIETADAPPDGEQARIK